MLWAVRAVLYIEAWPVQTLGTLQKTPQEGPDLLKDRAGEDTGNGGYSKMDRSELFCLWNLGAVGLCVLYYHKNTWLLFAT